MNTYLNQFSLEGRVAVVIGASEGIGHDLALGMAKAGADLGVCSRREPMLQELKKKIEAVGRRAEVFVLDVCKLGDIQDLKPFILDRFGKADILVNNAMYKVRGPSWDITESDWDVQVDTGLKGVFFCSQVVGSIMRNRKYGKIISLSSTFAISSPVGQAVYGTVKAGVSHLTEMLAVEWAPDGIRVNAIAPTATRTPSREKTLTAERLEKAISHIPLGRLGTPEDLMGGTIYLASAASDFVTGHTLFMDGGWMAM